MNDVSRRKILHSGAGAIPLAMIGKGYGMSESAGGQLSKMKSFSAIGKGSAALDGHSEATLLEHTGRGCLSHMWFGGDWPGYEKTRLRVYVDGETTPSINMELGLGHGDGFPDGSAPWGSARMGKTGNKSGLYNTYRIPFGRHIRVTGQRHPDGPAESAFWWIVRGSEGLVVRIGGVQLPEAARLHLYRLDDHVAQPLEEFDLCDVGGSGSLYQVTVAAQGLKRGDGWQPLSFMEACMRGYFGGSVEPTMLSSGFEDYFLGTYYFQRGRYSNELAGLTHLDEPTQSVCAYRFHDDDPIFFSNGLRLTCRCGETVDGSRNGPVAGNPPPTRYRTYAWLYQW